MTQDMKDMLAVLPSLVFGVGSGVFAWRHLGGWRGVRTPRISLPLLVGALGVVPMLIGSSLAMIMGGVALLMVGMTTAGGWYAARAIQLQRALLRLDDYVQGSAPLPIPHDDPTVARDVALAARLVADHALAHAMDPLVIERIGDLHAGRAARPLPASRA